MRTDRRLAPALVAVGCAMLLAGCASMPTSGEVREAAQGNAAEQPETGSAVRVFANPPQPGMTPTQIVNGFLDAMNSVEPDFTTAKEYLAAPDEWDPSARVRVYNEGAREVRASGSGYELEADKVGEVGPDGAYRAAAPGDPVRQEFALVKVGDEWRINHPPPGVLLANLDFTREYVSTDGPINLYFFDPSYRVLVPDPIYLPQRADLLTAVTEAVLRGPTERLSGAVASAVPTGTKLASRPVTVVNGEITVRLDRKAANLEESQRKLLTAQLVWTLSRISEGASILVTADGVPLYPQPTTTAAWDAYRPSAPSTEQDRVYLLRDGQLATYDRALEAAEPQLLKVGGSGDRALGPLAAFAVSPNAREIAGISDDRKRLLRIRLDAPRDEPKQLWSGNELASPSWDRFGGLWVLDSRESAIRVYFFDDTGARHEVAVAGPGHRKIIRLAVASNGTRVALITQQPGGQQRLELGLVKTSPVEQGAADQRRRGVRPVSIVGLDLLSPQLNAPTDVAWVDAQQLVVLNKDSTGFVQPYQIGVDGRLPDPLGGVSDDPVSVAAGGTDIPILMGTKQDKIWELSTSAGPAPNRFWRPLPGVRGSSPAYPG